MKTRRFQTKVCVLKSEPPLSFLAKCEQLALYPARGESKGFLLGETDQSTRPLMKRPSLFQVIVQWCPPPVTPFHAPGAASQPWWFYSQMKPMTQKRYSWISSIMKGRDENRKHNWRKLKQYLKHQKKNLYLERGEYLLHL